MGDGTGSVEPRRMSKLDKILSGIAVVGISGSVPITAEGVGRIATNYNEGHSIIIYGLMTAAVGACAAGASFVNHYLERTKEYNGK